MIAIEGHSDDVLVIEGPAGSVGHDEFEEGDLVELGTWEPAQGRDTAGVRVQMKYGLGSLPGAVWVAAISQLDEGAPVPWPVRVTHARREQDPGAPPGYSVRVEVDCPIDTPVRVRNARGRETFRWTRSEGVVRDRGRE